MPKRTAVPRRVTLNLGDQDNGTQQEPDIAPRVEEPSSPVYGTPEESPGRPTRDRRPPSRFKDFIME